MIFAKLVVRQTLYSEHKTTSKLNMDASITLNLTFVFGHNRQETVYCVSIATFCRNSMSCSFSNPLVIQQMPRLNLGRGIVPPMLRNSQIWTTECLRLLMLPCRTMERWKCISTTCGCSKHVPNIHLAVFPLGWSCSSGGEMFFCYVLAKCTLPGGLYASAGTRRALEA